MNIDSIPIVDMSYIGSSFQHNSDIVHYSQLGLKPIAVKLMFKIPGDDTNGTGSPMKIAAVKVPRSLPIMKLRKFINHCEDQLSQKYACRVRRLPFLFVLDVETNTLRVEEDLPTFQVMYV